LLPGQSGTNEFDPPHPGSLNTFPRWRYQLLLSFTFMPIMAHHRSENAAILILSVVTALTGFYNKLSPDVILVSLLGV